MMTPFGRAVLRPRTPQPWWATDPVIIAAREEVQRWLESAGREPMPVDNFEAIHNEVGSGSC